MKIKDLPESSKPRERFLKHGPEALSDAELFAIILRTGTQGENIIELSNKLISQFGLKNLFDKSLKELQQIKGIGPNKAMQILAMAELGERYNQSKNNIKKISSAEDVFKLFHGKLKNKKQEHFYMLMLNTKNHIIAEELISKGVLDSVLLEPREVFRPAIRNSSSKIIIIHNHPSGDPTPSEEDLEITKRLMDAGKVLNIGVLDHIIIGNGSYWNFSSSRKV